MGTTPTILKERVKKKTKGNQKSNFKIFTDANTVDVNGKKLPSSVQLVANCVAFHRQKQLPIKTIWLCPVHYNIFDYWWRSCALEYEADLGARLLSFDGVEIDLMPKHHVIHAKHGTVDMDWNFYEPERKEIN